MVALFLSAVSTVKGTTENTTTILEGDSLITRGLGIRCVSFFLNTLEKRFIFLSTHLNVFGVCNLADIFPVFRGRFHYEAIYGRGYRHITRNLGILYISFSFTLERRFVELIYFLEYSFARFRSMQTQQSFCSQPITLRSYIGRRYPYQ